MTRAARRADNYFVYKPRPNDGRGHLPEQGDPARHESDAHQKNTTGTSTPTPAPQEAANGHREATCKTGFAEQREDVKKKKKREDVGGRDRMSCITGLLECFLL